MANAIAVLDAVRERVPEDAAWARSSGASRSSSTPASASSRSTPSCARCPSSGRSSAASATASPTPSTCASATACRSTRSGLTEAQPENNVQRIVLEALAVTLGRDARARAIQLPAWNEALGLPAPVGPAVVAAHPAGPGLRDRPARVPRHLRGLEGDGRPRRRAARGRARRDGRRRRARRRRRGRRLHEGRARRLPPRAPPPHRVRRADRRRPEPLHRDRALAADRRRRGRHPRRRPRRRGRAESTP